MGVSFFLFCNALGCEPKKMIDPKEALKAKASEYWKKRLLDKDYKATYDMELEKSTIPYNKYITLVQNSGQMAYLNIRIEDVAIDGNKGSLVVKGKWQIPSAPVPISSSIKDHWILEGNQWKHILISKGKK